MTQKPRLYGLELTPWLFGRRVRIALEAAVVGEVVTSIG